MASTPRPLVAYFADLPDPRIQLKCDRDFLDIILIVVCATTGGADDFVSVAAFARAKVDRFRDRLGLKLRNGIPSHDTLNRVFALPAPAPFLNGFMGWVESMSGALKLKHIPIDGKAMRGSKRNTAAGYRTAHIVGAWGPENGVTLAQVRTDEKSNEITAIPELLALLDISGALVSIDAVGTQKEIAAQIVEQKGDYLVAVKENQPRLFEDLKGPADEALEAGFGGLSTDLQQGTRHGREEMRFCFVIENVEPVRDRALWPKMRSLVGAVSSRVVRGKATDGVRYYISSRKAPAKQFQKVIRSRWSIENSCHWVRDVARREDHHRLREGRAPENMSLVRKRALAMLKKADAKMGIENKRLQAGWDEAFLEHVLRDFLDE